MKKIIAILSVVLSMILFATPVFAGGAEGLSIDGQDYEEAAEGDGSKGGTWKWDGNSELNLNDFKSDHAIYSEDHALNITLNGENEVGGGIFNYDTGTTTITGEGSLETTSIECHALDIVDTTVTLNADVDSGQSEVIRAGGDINIVNSDVNVNAIQHEHSYEYLGETISYTCGDTAIKSSDGDVNIKDSNVDIKIDKKNSSEELSDPTQVGINANNVNIDNSNVNIALSEPGVPITTIHNNKYTKDTTDGKINLKNSTIKTKDAAIIDLTNNTETDPTVVDMNVGIKEQFIGKGNEGAFIVNRNTSNIPSDRYLSELEITANDQSKISSKTKPTEASNYTWTNNNPVVTNDPTVFVNKATNLMKRSVENVLDTLLLQYHLTDKTKQFLDKLGKNPINRMKIPNGRDYSNWARETNSIRPVEYAALCHIANDVGSDVGLEKIAKNQSINTRSELFYSLMTGNNIAEDDKIKYSLPEGHPLSTISPENVFFFEDGEKGEVEGAVIALDEKTAIVVFCGTDPSESKIDVAADIDIFTRTYTGSTVGKALEMEIGVTLDVIRKLQNRGFENIYVCGHSLGGYLAVNTAIMPAVKEVYALDSPGTSQGAVSVLSEYSHKLNYIRNRGSGVSAIGMYVPEARQSEIELTGNKDTNSAGRGVFFLSEHSMLSTKCSMGAPDMIESANDEWSTQWKKAISSSETEYMFLEPKWKAVTRYLDGSF